MQTRADLVEKATALFATNGFTAVSIDAICAEIGLSRGGFYHHFADKVACFEAVWVAQQEKLLASTNKSADAVENLSRFLDSCSEPVFSQICLIDAPAALGWERWRELENVYGLATITEGLGSLGKINNQSTSKLVFATIIEAALLLAHAEDPASERQEIEMALLAMVTGLPDQDHRTDT